MEVTKIAIYVALVVILLADVIVSRPHGSAAGDSNLLDLVKDSKS